MAASLLLPLFETLRELYATGPFGWLALGMVAWGGVKLARWMEETGQAAMDPRTKKPRTKRYRKPSPPNQKSSSSIRPSSQAPATSLSLGDQSLAETGFGERDFGLWDACAQRHLEYVEALFAEAGIRHEPLRYARDPALLDRTLDTLEAVSGCQPLVRRIRSQWQLLTPLEQDNVLRRLPAAAHRLARAKALRESLPQATAA